MLKHYLKLAVRNFRSNRLICGGSIVTTFLGAICIALLFSYVNNELSMEDFHHRESDIYAVLNQASAQSQPALTDARSYFRFKPEEFESIEAMTSLQKYKEGELEFKIENTIYTPEGLVVDSNFLKVFDY